MLALKINNKKIESAFIKQFDADKGKLISFIENSLKKLEKSKKTEFQFSHLAPLENYHRLEFSDTKEDTLSNPFEKVENAANFSKTLRNSSYR